jgi:Protein of unknown function (DUF2490)
MKFYLHFTLLLLCCTTTVLSAQNTRISDPNTIGWYNYFGTFKLNKKWGIHTEYQFRRDNIVTNWQQSLLRFGVNYDIKPNVQLRIGYAWIETFPYGDIPINGLGRDFTEHRTFQMVTLTDKIGIVDLSHRFMLEQRWVGRYSTPAEMQEDEFPLLHRVRYMFRCQLPLKQQNAAGRMPYLAFYDEIFIGFGENVNENIFDQNRIGLLFGYRFNSRFRIEGGYLNQTLQLGREVEGRNVFQSNNGIIINAYLNISRK